MGVISHCNIGGCCKSDNPYDQDALAWQDIKKRHKKSKVGKYLSQLEEEQ